MSPVWGCLKGRVVYHDDEKDIHLVKFDDGSWESLDNNAMNRMLDFGEEEEHPQDMES